MTGALLAAALGCGEACPPLSRVRVSGGEPEAERAVVGVLTQLERELALPVCIDHVRIGWIEGAAHLGAYNPVTRGIRVAADTPPEDLPTVVRHEVCHGVDRQNDVVRDHPGVFDDADAGGREAAESFAWACQEGRAPFSVLWDDGCPTTAAAEVLRDEVFAVSLASEPAAWFEPVAGRTVPAGGSFYVHGTVGGALSISGSVPSGWYDPWTGDPLEPGGSLEGAWDPLEPVAVPAPPAGWQAGDRSGGPLDAHRALLSGWYEGNVRLMARVGDRWAPVDAPCPTTDAQFFALGDELWMAQLDGDWLGWGRWRVSP
ncbi:MAG: hypothetical protein ABMA64_13405 [Myxococcota bacterium]